MAANNNRIVHIKWDKFDLNFCSELCPYFENRHLSDVSIGSEDGKKIRAHKIVLSIGSGYFRKIFEMDATTAFVFLPEIDSKIVKFVLYFMYHGSVNIPNKDLDAFEKAASFLRLNGFEESDSKTSNCHTVLIENVEDDSVNQSNNNSAKRKRCKKQSKQNGSRADRKKQLNKLTSSIVEDSQCDNNIDSISLISSEVELSRDQLFELSSTSSSNNEDHGSEIDSSIDLIN